MPNLNEYIGSIVSSITNSRVMSDAQSVKVAEQYAKHDLLKHFSIPRMRIEDIELSIPVAIDEIIEKTETEYEPIDDISFNKLVYQELVNNAGLTKLKSDVSTKLRSHISRSTIILEQNIRMNKNVSFLMEYCFGLVKYSRELLASFVSKKRITEEEEAKNLYQILIQEIKIIKETKTIADLNVIIEAHRLREQKPENILQIKLKIREDGLEWDKSEDKDGNIISKLLPE